MLVLLIITIFYILSVMFAYKYMQKAHYHPDGIFRGTEYGSVEIIVIFLPLMNSMITIDYILGAWKEKEKKKPSTFFKPRKPFKNEDNSI